MICIICISFVKTHVTIKLFKDKLITGVSKLVTAEKTNWHQCTLIKKVALFL